MCAKKLNGKKASETRSPSVRGNSYQRWVGIISKDFDILTTKENFIKRNIIRMKCKKCNHIHERERAYTNGCPKCRAMKQGSKPEDEIYTFIKQHTTLDIIRRFRLYAYPEDKRKFRELDIFIPVTGIAIEFDGVYWHSELAGKNNNYHLEKTELCNKEGIHLIHIFGNEWRDKQNIVKSILRSKLNSYDHEINVDNCYISELDDLIKNSFLKTNDINGTVKSDLNIGLFHDDTLVELLTFNKNLMGWKINSHTTKLNHNIPNGLSKLFEYFLNTYHAHSIDQTVIELDKRFHNGTTFKQLGFSLTGATNPTYSYFKRRKFYYNMNYDKVKDNLAIFDPNLTEWHNMQNNGYNRIWDCGKSVYIYN